MADFEISVNKTLAWEGGYVHDLFDPGGETRFGISKRFHPNLDIAALTVERAKEIYRAEYWNPLYDGISSQEVADELFDFGVNIGRPLAVRIFQEAIRYLSVGPVVIDGVFGQKTLEAANALEPKLLLREFRARQAYYYADLVIRQPDASEPDKKRFLLGWLRRVMA
jgi:lysozyme family protein